MNLKMGNQAGVLASGTEAAVDRTRQIELKFCKTVIEHLRQVKYHTISAEFQQPVHWRAMNWDMYPSVVTHPMDLTTVAEKMDLGKYRDAKDVEADIRLMFDNCFAWNPVNHTSYLQGEQFRRIFQQKWQEKEAFCLARMNRLDLDDDSSSEADRGRLAKRPKLLLQDYAKKRPYRIWNHSHPGKSISNPIDVAKRRRLLQDYAKKRPDRTQNHSHPGESVANPIEVVTPKEGNFADSLHTDRIGGNTMSRSAMATTSALQSQTNNGFFHEQGSHKTSTFHEEDLTRILGPEKLAKRNLMAALNRGASDDEIRALQRRHQDAEVEERQRICHFRATDDFTNMVSMTEAEIEQNILRSLEVRQP